MFKDKKTLKTSVINHIKSLLKNNEVIKVVYTELNNNNKRYEEDCLLFFSISQTFVYHYWYANKIAKEEIDINSVDFGLIHSVGINNIEKLINPIIIEKANYYLKDQLNKKLSRQFPNKNTKNHLNKI